IINLQLTNPKADPNQRQRRGKKKGSERMWESIVLTVAATAGNNIGKILQKKGTIILPPLSFKLKACFLSSSFPPLCP
ncbi:hypothetical protein SESBI_10137, partial [Sesbania bispinosa]